MVDGEQSQCIDEFPDSLPSRWARTAPDPGPLSGAHSRVAGAISVITQFRDCTMSVFVCRRALSTATASAASASVRSAGTVSSPVSAASSFAVAAASTKDVRISHPPRISSSRPSALLEAYVRQPPPPPPEPDNAWKRDMFSVMASSPMRECNVTQSHLPSAFMVNFRVGEGEESNVVLPDRLEHPKWKRRRGGRSFWTALHRNAIDRLQGPRGESFGCRRQL